MSACAQFRIAIDILMRMQMPQTVFLQLRYHCFVSAKFRRNKITFDVRLPRAKITQMDLKND